eukprot:TRINITY_DN11846_c7_g1_i1.p1 TRINITY_DN11846_c7_g1~~TRINITY_DN11846_c7_g1_i1.p1  ORF type:complete len:431 (+),score=45.83 TRINITY_DN11846_c7_g1_i1:76-1368(+)
MSRKITIAVISILVIGAIVALSYLGATNQLQSKSGKSSGASSSNTTTYRSTTTTTTTISLPTFDVLDSGLNNDEFGKDAIAIFNTTIAVGTKLSTVYLYSISEDNTIQLMQTLSGPTAAFPAKLNPAFSADGLLAVANDETPSISAGIRIYSINASGLYTEDQFLNLLGGQSTGFGTSIVLPNSYTIVVSAPQANPAGKSLAGQVYIYRKEDDDSDFGPAQLLVANDAADDAEFGIDVSAHGDLLAIGAHAADSFAGAVYIFKSNGGATSYVQIAKLSASDSVAHLRFGLNVQLNANRLFVTSVERNQDRGAVYTFEHDQVQFNETAIMTSPVEQNFGQFGYDIGFLNDDLLISEVNPRNLYRYSLNLSAASGYSLVGTITPDNNLTNSSGFFGGTLASEGSTLLVTHNGPSISVSSVYVFFPNAMWTIP